MQFFTENTNMTIKFNDLQNKRTDKFDMVTFSNL